MKRSGIVHPELARALASLGHTDVVCIADVGLPVPPSVPRIDLAYRLGSPGFADVLEAVAAELVVEAVTMASESDQACPDLVARVGELFPRSEHRRLSHEDVKSLTAGARVVIRTGETTPYANVLLHSGVPF